MGAGLYLVWPAFYTDVTDSYRLGRAGRIRTDLGGLYFNAIVVVLTFVWWWATGWEALLLLVATQVLQMVQQLLPLLRFDGYHVLADLAGRPGPLPPDPADPARAAAAPLEGTGEPGAQAVGARGDHPVGAGHRPDDGADAAGAHRGRAAAPGQRRLGRARGRRRRGRRVERGRRPRRRRPRAAGAGSRAARAGLRPRPRPGRRPVLRGTRRVEPRLGGQARGGGRGQRRPLVTALSWAWWPHPGHLPADRAGRAGALRLVPAGAADRGRRRPARSRGARPSGALPAGTAAQDRLSSDEPLVAAFQEDADAADQGRPGPCHGARPHGRTAGTEPARSERRAEHRSRRAEPEHRGRAARRTTPGSSPSTSRCRPRRATTRPSPSPPTTARSTYDVAFALVWAEDDEVLNVNEAHAYASCSDCVAVAVAFQVVLIMDDAQVVVPQNLAVAANYDCYRCITAAIASQLVLSVQEEPGRGGAAGPGRGVEPADRSSRARSRRTPSRRSPHSSRPSRPRSSRSWGTRRPSTRAGSTTSSSTPTQNGSDSQPPTAPTHSRADDRRRRRTRPRRPRSRPRRRTPTRCILARPRPNPPRRPPRTLRPRRRRRRP